MKIGCRLLELMTRDLDNAIVMAANSAKAILTTAIDKHSVKEVYLLTLYCDAIIKGACWSVARCC